jgi:hypothetical protein
MKKRILAGVLVAAGALGLALVPDSPREGCDARCCRRPAGAPVESCLRRDPHTGIATDFGDLNTMPGTHAVGSGCEATECVLGVGVEWLDGGAL